MPHLNSMPVEIMHLIFELIPEGDIGIRGLRHVYQRCYDLGRKYECRALHIPFTFEGLRYLKRIATDSASQRLVKRIVYKVELMSDELRSILETLPVRGGPAWTPESIRCSSETAAAQEIDKPRQIRRQQLLNGRDDFSTFAIVLARLPELESVEIFSDYGSFSETLERVHDDAWAHDPRPSKIHRRDYGVPGRALHSIVRGAGTENTQCSIKTLISHRVPWTFLKPGLGSKGMDLFRGLNRLELSLEGDIKVSGDVALAKARMRQLMNVLELCIKLEDLRLKFDDPSICMKNHFYGHTPGSLHIPIIWEHSNWHHPVQDLVPAWPYLVHLELQGARIYECSFTQFLELQSQLRTLKLYDLAVPMCSHASYGHLRLQLLFHFMKTKMRLSEVHFGGFWNVDNLLPRRYVFRMDCPEILTIARIIVEGRATDTEIEVTEDLLRSMSDIGVEEQNAVWARKRRLF